MNIKIYTNKLVQLYLGHFGNRLQNSNSHYAGGDISLVRYNYQNSREFIIYVDIYYTWDNHKTFTYTKVMFIDASVTYYQSTIFDNFYNYLITEAGFKEIENNETNK